MIRCRLLAGSLVASLLALGCEERIEHADPEAIQQFDAVAAKHSRNSMVATGSPTGSAQPPAPISRPTASSPVAGGDAAVAQRALAVHLIDAAAESLETLPAGFESSPLVAALAWHLDRLGKPHAAAALFQKARRTLETAPSAELRLARTSQLIALCGGKVRDADYGELLAEADRLVDESVRSSKPNKETGVDLPTWHFQLFPALVRSGRYDEAMRRLEALKSPELRGIVAAVIVRDLARRDRMSDVRRCAEIIRQASPVDSQSENSGQLCWVHALADDPVAAERILRSLPPPTDTVDPLRITPLSGLQVPGRLLTPARPPGAAVTYTSAGYRRFVDVAAALRRRGDRAGCIRLLETELERVIVRDPTTGIAAWVECDEFERAAELVRRQVDPAMKPRLAAVLCLATVERGAVGLARRFAGEFEQFPFAPKDFHSKAAFSFDSRFLSPNLADVVPLLLGDERRLRERVDLAAGPAQCEPLLRVASLLRLITHPKADSCVPFQEETLTDKVFESRYLVFSSELQSPGGDKPGK